MLQVQNLTLAVPGPLTALRSLSFSLAEGGSLGIVGESGSGKTLTALAIAGLSAPQIQRTAGSISFAGRELTTLDTASMRALRGRELAVIFQDSSGALNPLMPVLEQITEGMTLFDKLPAKEAAARAAQLATEVELPQSALEKYPHQLSGGQRQRVMIAIALARQPRMVIADEPTTALDLTTQQALLELLLRLHQQQGSALLLISHDISVVRKLCQELIVLYAGEVMERGATAVILANPRHPYTKGLLGALPTFAKRGQPLATLGGFAEPIQARPDSGCVFRRRCSQSEEGCQHQVPSRSYEDGVTVHCHLTA